MQKRSPRQGLPTARTRPIAFVPRHRPCPADGLALTPGIPRRSACARRAAPCGVRQRTLREVLKYLPAPSRNGTRARFAPSPTLNVLRLPFRKIFVNLRHETHQHRRKQPRRALGAHGALRATRRYGPHGHIRPAPHHQESLFQPEKGASCEEYQLLYIIGGKGEAVHPPRRNTQHTGGRHDILLFPRRMAHLPSRRGDGLGKSIG